MMYKISIWLDYLYELMDTNNTCRMDGMNVLLFF